MRPIADLPRAGWSFSTLYGSSGFFNPQYPADDQFPDDVSVPSTGQVDSSTVLGRRFVPIAPIVSVPSTGQVDSSTREAVTRRHCADYRFSTLYGSSGFFNVKRDNPNTISIHVSVPSTGQVDSSTLDRAFGQPAQGLFQYPLRVKWILQRR